MDDETNKVNLQVLPDGEEATPSELPASKGAEIAKTKTPRIRDGLMVFAAIIVVWLAIAILLGLLRPYLSDRGLVYLSSFLTQGSMAAIIGIFLYWRGIDLKTLGYRKVPWGSTLLSAFLAYVLVMSLNLVYSMYLYFQHYKPSEPESYRLLFAQHDIIFIFLNIFLAAVVAPILEETLFRGIIYKSLRSKLGMGLSAVLSAALFSGLHMDFWGFIPRFLLGIALAYLYEKKGSLYPSMTLHALNNSIALLINLAQH